MKKSLLLLTIAFTASGAFAEGTFDAMKNFGCPAGQRRSTTGVGCVSDASPFGGGGSMEPRKQDKKLCSKNNIPGDAFYKEDIVRWWQIKNNKDRDTFPATGDKIRIGLTNYTYNGTTHADRWSELRGQGVGDIICLQGGLL